MQDRTVATDLVKSWLSAGDRIERARAVVAEAHRQNPAPGPKLSPAVAWTALEVFVIRGLVAELEEWDAYPIARDAVARADIPAVMEWLVALDYRRSADPLAEIIGAWDPVGRDM